MKKISLLLIVGISLFGCKPDAIENENFITEEIKAIVNSTGDVIEAALSNAISKDDLVNPDDIINPILSVEGVASAQISPFGSVLYIQLDDGTFINKLLITRDDERWFMDSDEVETTLPSQNQVAKTKTTSNIILPNGSRKAVILAPFQKDFKSDIEDMSSYLKDIGYSVVVHANEKAKLDKFRGDTLREYNIVIILSHGSCETKVREGSSLIDITEIITASKWDENFLNSHPANERKTMHMAFQDQDVYFALSPQWLKATTTGRFNNTWVFISACQSSVIDSGPGSLSEAFFDLGVEGYNGFDGNIDNGLAKRMEKTMVRHFSAGQSFDAASTNTRADWNSYAKVKRLLWTFPSNKKTVNAQLFTDSQKTASIPFYILPPEGYQLIPTVIISSIDNITSSSAIASCEVTYEGLNSVTARGVCWSTSQNPTTANSKTTDGTGLGTYTSNITGLSPNTTYYVRAYATNSEGTAYGEQRSFNTNQDAVGDTFTDSRDGNIYKMVTIGNQTWMAENLKYLPKVTGTATSSETEACYYVYDYDGTNVAEAKSTANYQTYGVLYNWPAAMNGAATSNTIPSGVQGICPPGWHLPSDAEWKQLEMYLGMSQSEADKTGLRGTDEGGKMKHPGTEYWAHPNTGATNSSGFTALPGGYFWDSKFSYIIVNGFWWSSTQILSDVAWFRVLEYGGNKINRTSFYKKNGLSVRCVKDYQKEPGSSPDYGTYTDVRDQTIYKTITINGKEWLAENLKYLPKVTGTATSSETEACYYVYDYDGTNVAEAKSTANYQTYGVLYNWPAAMNGAATSNTIPSGVQGVCPPGWHLPSDAEWKQLEMYLGMSQSEADKTGLRGTDEGGKMKHPGTEYWAHPNTGATNSSGFTALPGGYFWDSKFSYIIVNGFWWSSTQILSDVAWFRVLEYGGNKINRTSFYKKNGLSVRCVRD